MPGGGVGGVTSFGQIEPPLMARLAACARLLSPSAAAAVASAAAATVRRDLSSDMVALHVMARETKLQGVIDDCEATWAGPLRRVYYHADRSVAQVSLVMPKLISMPSRRRSSRRLPRRHSKPTCPREATAASLDCF